MANIKDVAEMSGVSISTVSRALSGKAPVSAETKRRVMEAVRKLNFRPNVFAQGLKNGGTNLIALIIPNIMNPIFPIVARGVEDTARNLGYNVILCNTDENIEIEKSYIGNMLSEWVDGYIFATAGKNSEHIINLHKQGIPIVLLIRTIEQELEKEFYTVTLNNVKGSYEMTKYLLQSGMKRIGLINGNKDILLYRERYKGYCDALEEKGIKLDNDIIFESRDANGADIYNAVCEMIQKGICPDAFFAESDPFAIKVLAAVKDCGLKVPDDVSIVGFDNLDVSSILDPPLTTMSQPLYKMGALSAKCLIDQIENKDEAVMKPKHFIMNSKLIIRKSLRV